MVLILLAATVMVAAGLAGLQVTQPP